MTFDVLCASCPNGSAINEAVELYDCSVFGTLRAPRKCMYYAGPVHFPVDAAIITAVQVETDAVWKWLNPAGRWQHHSTQDALAWYSTEIVSPANPGMTFRVVLAQARMKGLPAAAVQAALACQLYSPRYLIMPGITAGHSKKTNLGDIIVPDNVFDYGAGIWNGAEFSPAPHQLDLDTEVYRNCERIKLEHADLLDGIRKDWPTDIPGAHSLTLRLGQHAVSGASIINSKNVWEQILSIDKDVIAIDMEAYSVLLAGRQASSGPKVLVAKSVCDFGVEKNDEAQEYAAFTSARFIRLYIDLFLFEKSSAKSR
jgi:nucleoside phosphorylase